MADVSTAPMSAGERGGFMGRTRGALRSVRSVLGGGGEYLQGLGSRIGTVLTNSLEESSSSSSGVLNGTLSMKTSSTSRPAIDNANVTAAAERETDARKKLRFPRFRSGMTTYEDYDAMIRRKLQNQKMQSRATRAAAKMSYDEIAAAPGDAPEEDQAEARPKDAEGKGHDRSVGKIDLPTNSGSTSEHENRGRSESLDSTTDRESTFREWPRSGSSGSIQSWASSLSAESQSEEPATDFMKSFVPLLFDSPSKIDQQQKASFGQMVQTEPGRIWFSRVINARRCHPCVTEESFYSLAQHFAVALFECHEADDFAPAKSLMNMCFTFYHEIEVPGIEPYREYLYTNIRDQPIWTSMRFWTAAFFRRGPV